MMQLDLSRRRVAAISFLSNISVTELTDEQKSEQNNLHCLQVSTIYFYVIQESFQTPLMPCPFTGPKMFWAGPNFLC